MRTLFNQPNVNKSDLFNYPSGRVKDNSGVGDGTRVNEATKGDFHQMLEKLMRLYAIIPNDLPDNETNGFQLIDALRGLASKNDFIYPLSTNGTILSVDIKFSQMLDNEYIVCLAAFNKAAETQIKGIGAGTFTITYSGNFKTNEYVRVIKTSGGVSIIRVADAVSLDAMVADALYLKKASQAEENSGSIDTVATTPKVNKITYALRTIGADSINYLATAIRNGLYPKEHFAIVAGLGKAYRYGTVSALNIGSSGSGNLVPSGDISSSTLPTFSSGGSDTDVYVYLTNPMPNLNFFVRISINGLSAGLINDCNILVPVWKILSDSSITFRIRETSEQTQSLKFHIEFIEY